MPMKARTKSLLRGSVDQILLLSSRLDAFSAWSDRPNGIFMTARRGSDFSVPYRGERYTQKRLQMIKQSLVFFLQVVDDVTPLTEEPLGFLLHKHDLLER